MNKYEPYNDMELYALMNEPWEVSDNPYKLHAAYAISCLYDLICADDDDEDSAPAKEDIWKSKMPKKIVDRLVQDIAIDFNDAAQNRTKIRIWGKSYSIRRVNAYDPKRLHLIFGFEEDGDEYIINRNGIMDLSGATQDSLKQYEVGREQSKINRTYVRQIIKLAEDDKNNGWDKLTDMEIVVYCWALHYNKTQSENMIKFLSDYKDYIYVNKNDIQDCFNEKSAFRQRPVGMYPFSRDLVLDWSTYNHQKSYAILIPQEEADDYWYNTALKKSFKPIDFK